MPGSAFDASGPLDVSTLEVLAKRATTHPLVRDAAFQPDSITPRVLEIHLDATQYPPPIDAVRLDVRWFEGGEYSIHYLETEPSGTWQCRWDCHPKPDAPTEHFHPPPDAGPVSERSTLDGDHHLTILFSVLDWVEGRVQELYDG